MTEQAATTGVQELIDQLAISEGWFGEVLASDAAQIVALAAGTAGVIQRDLVDGSANNHIYVNGPAKCVAFTKLSWYMFSRVVANAGAPHWF